MIYTLGMLARRRIAASIYLIRTKQSSHFFVYVYWMGVIDSKHRNNEEALQFAGLLHFI